MAGNLVTPTDHGYAVVFRQGTSVNVAVVASVGAAAGDAFAVHYDVREVKAGAGVRFVEADGVRRTERPVAVTGGADGIVRLRARPAAVLPAAALRS